MDAALTWFIRLWLFLAIGINLVAIIGLFAAAESIWQGWSRVTEVYSPFNVFNVLAELLLLAPAIGVYYWRERRREQSA